MAPPTQSESHGAEARVLSAIAMTGTCEPFDRRQAVRYLQTGRIIILAGGTGSPFFTTDTCAALRVRQLGAEVLLKGTKVDGVYDCDPQTNPSAKRYSRLTYEQVLAEKLGVMDLTAISMCMEAKIPVVVYKLTVPGNTRRVICGEDVGTTISH